LSSQSTAAEPSVASALSAARAGSAGRGAGGAGGRAASIARGGSGARAPLSGADAPRVGLVVAARWPGGTISAG
jgi:hypothetical protein